MSESSDILKEVYEASGKQPNTVPENQLGAKAKKNSALFGRAADFWNGVFYLETTIFAIKKSLFRCKYNLL